MLNYIIGGLMIAGLVALIIIIARKFSILANINLDVIEAEKQARVKNRIIAEKLKRQLSKWPSQASRVAKPIWHGTRKGFYWLYDKLVNIKDDYIKDEQADPADLEKKINALFLDADDLARREELVGAENKYIEIIGLDSQNAKAFEALGGIYLEKQNYQEARQTLDHAVLLFSRQGEDAKSELARTYFSLAEVYQAMNDLTKAVDNLKQALKIEENNPRYLDKLIEVSILNKDKAEAWGAFKKLQQVNPDNQKLSDLKAEVNKL